jgi:hypothetical protein
VLLDVMRALGRRWYVLVVGLVMTAGLAYGAYVISPPEYTARGLILLLPSEVAVGEAGNPFLVLGGLEQPAGIVVAYFASASAQAEVEDHSPTAQFLVAIDDSTRGPVIAVNVTDSSEEAALSTLDFLMDRIPEELERLQTEVAAPADAVITSMPLTADTVAEVDRSGMIRLVIAAIAVGMLLTGIVAFTLDGVLLRRAQRRTPSVAKRKATARAPGRVRSGDPHDDDDADDDDAAKAREATADDPAVDTALVPTARGAQPVSARPRQP